jgi:hypothetical protein
MEPSVWGKYLWSSIHFIALGFPDKPTQEDKNIYRQFYTDFWKVIPCHKCSQNYIKHLQELPIEPYLVDNMTLFEWTVKLHNIVNKKLHKREWSLEEAKDKFRNLAKGGDEIGFVSINSGWDKIIRYTTSTSIIIMFILLLWYVMKKKVY